MNKPLSKEADALIREIVDTQHPMETETLKPFLKSPGAKEVLVEHSEKLVVLTARAMRVILSRIQMNSYLRLVSSSENR